VATALRHTGASAFVTKVLLVPRPGSALKILIELMFGTAHSDAKTYLATEKPLAVVTTKRSDFTDQVTSLAQKAKSGSRQVRQRRIKYVR
jgi:hypothetical protein